MMGRTSKQHFESENDSMDMPGIPQSQDSLPQTTRDPATSLDYATIMETGLSLYLKAALKVSEMDYGTACVFDEFSGAPELSVCQNSAATGPGRKRSRRPEMHRPSCIFTLPVKHHGKTIGQLDLGSYSQTTVPAKARKAVEAVAVRMGNAVGSLHKDSRIHEDEMRHRVFIEGAGIGYAVISRTGAIVDASTAYARLLGLSSRSDVLGSRIFDLVDPQEIEKAAHSIRECMEKGFVRNVRINHRLPNQSVRPVEMNATSWNSGARRHVLAWFRDVSQPPTMETTEVRSVSGERETKGDHSKSVCNGILHDVHNLLSSMRSNLNMAAAEIPPTSAAHGKIKTAEMAARRAADLCRQIE